MRGGVLAGRDAGAAANALRRIHRLIGGALRDRQAVGVRRATDVHRNVATGRDDAVEGRPIDDEVLDDGEAPGAERLDRDRLAVAEAAHVDLAGGRALVGSVRDAVDNQPATAADAFAAIRIERDRVLAALDHGFVDDIEHLEEGHVGMDVVRGVVHEPAGSIRPGLPPHFQTVLACHIPASPSGPQVPNSQARKPVSPPGSLVAPLRGVDFLEHQWLLVERRRWPPRP